MAIKENQLKEAIWESIEETMDDYRKLIEICLDGMSYRQLEDVKEALTRPELTFEASNAFIHGLTFETNAALIRGLNFEMFTKEGNEAAQKMCLQLHAQIREGAITGRNQLLAEISNSMHEIHSTHPEIYDTEPEWHICDALNPAVRSRGWTPLNRDWECLD